MKSFDHVIVGTGQATGTLLGALLATGESIAVIEGDLVGGTCVNTGCTPTKALVATARVAHQIRCAREHGLHAGDLRVDFTAVMDRMNGIRGDSRASLERLIGSGPDVSLYRGWARFEGPRCLRVNDRVIEGERIYLNVGARPGVPDVPGLDDVPWLDSARVLDLTELPEHLVVLGGSYVGLEFSQIFRRLGSRVTVIEQGPKLMPREDEDVAVGVQQILEGEGVEILLGANAERVLPGRGGGVTIATRQGGASLDVGASHLLVAVGRVPNTDGLALERAGIRTDERGYIEVDDYCRTSVDAVWALGDVNGRGAFTHTSVNDAEIVVDQFRGGSRKLSDRIPTYALFIDPALGRVGLTEREALARGHHVLKATRPMSRINRAKEMGETEGFAKLLVDAETDLILGAAILGAGGDEIVNMISAYMYGGLPCRSYRRSVLIHPTISELMPWILDDLRPVPRE